MMNDTNESEEGKSASETENFAGENPVEGVSAIDVEGKTGQTEPAGETSGNETADSAPRDDSPQNKIAFLEAKLIEANDQFLRKAAEFENYRKRMVRERQEAVDYANQALLLDLIQVMDDFDRAVKAVETCYTQESPVFKTFYEGVSMIEKRLSSQLENKWGLKRFESEGQPFDPNRHEAIMMEKSAEVSEPVVQEELYKGYILKDRVVRNAKVKVIMPGAGD